MRDIKPFDEAIINIKYLRDIPKLQVNSKGDWIDLYVPFDVVLSKEKFENIPLGFALSLPDGYEAHIVPRSSTFMKYGIIQVNGMGIIDNSYSGNNDEWHFPCITLNDIVCIPKHARICQFRIVKKQPYIYFHEVNDLIGNDRGGFGSTGI